jgi:hypothetical protein
MQSEGQSIHPVKVIGNTHFKCGLQYWHYIELPDDFGPESPIRCSVSPVINPNW